MVLIKKTFASLASTEINVLLILFFLKCFDFGHAIQINIDYSSKHEDSFNFL